MWTEGTGLPYDGWYGGRVDMMIANGTYADFRPKLVSRVEKGKYHNIGTLEERIAKSQEKLVAWDKQWESIDIAERNRHRDRVADDSEVKEKVVLTARGPMKVFRSSPSCNNNLDKKDHREKKKAKRKLPSGAITRESNPIGTSQAAVSAAAAVGIKSPAAPSVPAAQTAAPSLVPTSVK